MNKAEVQKLIKEMRDNQEKYNRELEGIIGELDRAHISTTTTSTPPSDNGPIAIGDQVKITNPSRFGGKEGTVIKLTKTRVTVATTKGKVVRAHKNVKSIK